MFLVSPAVVVAQAAPLFQLPLLKAARGLFFRDDNTTRLWQPARDRITKTTLVLTTISIPMAAMFLKATATIHTMQKLNGKKARHRLTLSFRW